MLGKVGTRALPAGVEALKGGSEERILACLGWREVQRDEVKRTFETVGLVGTFDDVMYELEVDVEASKAVLVERNPADAAM